MQYVEMLRARRVLTWFCGILLAVFAITVISFYSGHVQISGGRHSAQDLSDLIRICAFGAMVVATCMAPGLNAESTTLAITWTRPIPRAAIAWRYIAVDAVAMLFAFLFMLAVGIAFIALFGGLGDLRFDAAIPAALLNVFGVSLMWYGLVTLVTARMDGRGGLISGLSWAAFSIIGGLWAAPFPPLLHGLITFLDYFNPLTYFNSLSTEHHVSKQVLNLDPSLLTLIAWCFVAVTLVATVRLWSTREV
jgi:hypothetical protein